MDLPNCKYQNLMKNYFSYYLTEMPLYLNWKTYYINKKRWNRFDIIRLFHTTVIKQNGFNRMIHLYK